ncbi:MAG: GntR family transcriptional regulator [Pseudomonadota bacterium]
MAKNPEQSGDVSFKRVDRDTVAGQIFEDLRLNIFNGTLARGAKLPTEKDLAEQYGVSGATIREAIRALSAMQLVKVRHGSGAYVTADAASLVAMSLDSMIQIERIGVPDVMGILGVLNTYAVELAATRATSEDIAQLRASIERLAVAGDVEGRVDGLSSFLNGMAAASHHPLLIAMCKFLAGLQIQLALELSGGDMATWQRTAGPLNTLRARLVDAIEAGDAAQARDLSREFHDHAQVLIMGLPNADAARVGDPKLSDLLSTLMRRSAA